MDRGGKECCSSRPLQRTVEPIDQHSRLGQGKLLAPLYAACDRLTPSDYARLLGYASEMDAWFDAVTGSIDDARQNHLSRYATAIKKATLKALAQPFPNAF